MTSPTPATPPLYTPWPYTPSGKAEAWVREKVLQMQGRSLTTDFTGAVEALDAELEAGPIQRGCVVGERMQLALAGA